MGHGDRSSRDPLGLRPFVVVPIFGCPRFGASLFLRLTWDTTNLNRTKSRGQRLHLSLAISSTCSTGYKIGHLCDSAIADLGSFHTFEPPKPKGIRFDQP